MNHDRYRLHPGIFEHHLCDPVGDPLDEIPPLSCDSGPDCLGQLTVVDGVPEIVGLPGKGQIECQRNIDIEELTLFTLLRKNPVMGKDLEAGQPDFVGQLSSQRPGSSLAPWARVDDPEFLE